jgi:AraC family transcriptional regulator
MSSLTVTKSSTAIIASNPGQWHGISLRHWHALPGELPEYVHPEHEINIPISGNLTSYKHTAVGRRQTNHGNATNICIVPAGQPIAVKWGEEVEGLTLSLTPSFVASAVSGGGTPPSQVELIEIYEAEDNLIRQIGLALLAEATKFEPSARLYAESLAQTLALHLVSQYGVSHHTPEKFRGGLSGYNLRRAKEFINEHLAQDLSLNDIAASVGLSQFHFARAFKRAMNLTPHQYVTERRIEHAKRLLSETDLSLIEITTCSGFKSQSHFTTRFRQFTNMTPKAWRHSKLS